MELLDLEIPQGAFCAILGPSGVGKTEAEIAEIEQGMRARGFEPGQCLARAGAEDVDELADACVHDPVLEWDNFGEPFLQQYCTGCHNDNNKKLYNGRSVRTPHGGWWIAGGAGSRAARRRYARTGGRNTGGSPGGPCPPCRRSA